MALAVFLIALLWGLAAATGTTDGTTGEFWGNVAMSVVRTGVASGLFLLFGLGITMVVNNSVGAIVGFVIYWFIVENFLLVAFLPKVAVYLPITNATSFASGRDVERIDGSVFGDFDVISHHGYQMAGVILAAWTIGSLAAASVVFTRRDIA
jgi:ABC-type transport system involved in multi-copper enzyme maturation permease subunit